MAVSCPNCSEHIEIPHSAGPAATSTISACCFRATRTTAVFGSCDQLRGGIFNARRTCRLFTRLHWAVFLPLWFWLAVALALFFTKNGAAVAVGAVLLVFAVIPMAITSSIARASSEFAITNKRVLIKTGWIRRYSLETLLTKVESIRVDQSALGRMLDYGTIIISGTGGWKRAVSQNCSANDVSSSSARSNLCERTTAKCLADICTFTKYWVILWGSLKSPKFLEISLFPSSQKPRMMPRLCISSPPGIARRNHSPSRMGARQAAISFLQLFANVLGIGQAPALRLPLRRC